MSTTTPGESPLPPQQIPPDGRPKTSPVGRAQSEETAAKAAKASKLKGYKRTAYAVWEITLKCNLLCQHCGSRAGEERKHELSTQEAFNLIHQMADVGITEVSL